MHATFVSEANQLDCNEFRNVDTHLLKQRRTSLSERRRRLRNGQAAAARGWLAAASMPNTNW
jgi:hypothetical protein